MADKQIGTPAKVAFVLTLLAGIGFAGFSLSADMNSSGEAFAALLPYFLLASALLVALGSEFVNGFHDTANAVATVIYTPPSRRTWPSSGRVSSTSLECSSRVVLSPSASSRYYRSN